MRYRTLDVRLWGDEKFRALTSLKPSGQALFLYLLTNPNTTSMPGLFRAGAAGMAEELGWTTEGFKEAFREVLDQGLVKADFESRVIFIPNAIKYNKPQSPNVVRSWASHWDEIPECELKNIAYHLLKSFVDALGDAFSQAFVEGIGKAMPNQEQDQKQEQEAEETHGEVKTSRVSRSLTDSQAVFSHWQTVMNHPHAKLDKKRKSAIMRALDLGYGIEQLKQAIDGCARTPYNMGKNDAGQRYDDIALILRDAAHIERFINNATCPPSPDKWSTPATDLMAGVI